MAAELFYMYIYLGRRDKSGVRVLARVRGYEILPTRVNDIEDLRLPADWTAQLKETIYENRMLWEPWAETALTYEDLKNSLRTRGYTNIPVSGRTELSSYNLSTPTINQNALPRKRIMVRKAR